MDNQNNMVRRIKVTNSASNTEQVFDISAKPFDIEDQDDDWESLKMRAPIFFNHDPQTKPIGQITEIDGDQFLEFTEESHITLAKLEICGFVSGPIPMVVSEQSLQDIECLRVGKPLTDGFKVLEEYSDGSIKRAVMPSFKK